MENINTINVVFCRLAGFVRPGPAAPRDREDPACSIQTSSSMSRPSTQIGAASVQPWPMLHTAN